MNNQHDSYSQTQETNETQRSGSFLTLNLSAIEMDPSKPIPLTGDLEQRNSGFGLSRLMFKVCSQIWMESVLFRFFHDECRHNMLP